MKKIIILTILAILFLGCLPALKKNDKIEFNKNVTFSLGSDVQKSGYSLKRSLYDDEEVWVSNEVVITNDNIREMYFEKDQYTGQMRLTISLNNESSALFTEFTEKNINKKLCIVSGEYVITNAVILEKIPGGKISVTGAFTQEKIDKLLN